MVYFEKVLTKWQGNCFKISVLSNDSEIAISKIRVFYLHFNQSIFMNVYITSKVNSNGVIFNDWKDGRAMKVSFGIPDFLKLVDLKSNEYRYSKTKKNCRLVILVYVLGQFFITLLFQKTKTFLNINFKIIINEMLLHWHLAFLIFWLFFQEFNIL